MKKDNQKDIDREGKLEFIFLMIFGCLHTPALLSWFPDAPDLLYDLYFSTIFFLLELAT